MAAPGQFTALINPAASAAHLDFAEALRDLCQFIRGSQGSQRQIAEQIHIGQSTLTAHLSAWRRPSLWLADKLSSVAQEKAEGDTRLPPVPVSRDALLELHRLAVVKHCACCRNGGRKSGEDPQALGLASDAPPSGTQDVVVARPAVCAVDSFEKMRRQRKRAQVIRRSRQQLPVPPQQGDRQRAVSRAPGGTALAGLIAHLQAGQAGDARVLLHHLGATAPASEVRDAVAAFRAAALDDEADTVLHHAGQRGPAETLSLVESLIAAHRYADVRLLIAATPPGGNSTDPARDARNAR